MELVQSASAMTLKSYGLDLRQAFQVENFTQLGGRAWSEAELLAQVRQAFQIWAPLSLASRNRKAATLKSFFSWAFHEGHLEQDLSLQISCPKVPKKIPHFLSVDEALAVLRSFTADKERLHEKLLFLLLYGGGLRVSEACQLRWSDVLLQQKVLRVKGKGSKERMVALPAVTVQALQEVSTESHQTYVFGEKALDQRKAYEMIRRSGQRAALMKPLHPHALRHSFATHLLSSGANLRTLQELLGHESLQATEKYTHLGVDQLARTLEKMHPLGRGK